MKISFEHLEIIDAIERNGSFAAAADELHKVRSAITYNIKILEENLGVTLFDRSGHRAILTDAGKLLLTEGRKLLINANRLEKHIQQIDSNWEPIFRIAYDAALDFKVIISLVKSFCHECPTELSISAEVLGGCWDALTNKRADLAIGVSGLMLGRDRYVLKSLGQLTFQFVISPKHPLAEQAGPLSTQQINQYPAVIVADSAHLLPSQSYDILSEQSSLTVSSIDEKKRIIEAGIGVGFLPTKLARQAAKNKSLIIKKVECMRSSAQLSTAWSRTKSSGKALKWWVNRLQSDSIKKSLLL